VFLFELRAIATRDNASDSELDPILVFWSFLFRGSSDCLLIARTTANSSSDKTSRTNQHQKFARGVRHSIAINI